MKLKIKKICEDNKLVVLAGNDGLDRLVVIHELSRPGVELVGFFDFFEPLRIVLCGSKEITFFNTRLNNEEQIECVDRLFKKNPPAFVFSKHVDVPQIFIDKGNEYNIPVLKSENLRTTALSSKLYRYLQERLAERTSIHGVLMNLNGMGTLITGKSGIGKSEVALELLHRGHQLISDDRVEIFEREVGVIEGSAPKILEKYMEIRGIGVVDVVEMFGASAYRENTQIDLVVELEKWEDGKGYDRLGLTNQTIKYFNTEIPKVVIPVSPGRNIATLVESAAMNEKLKGMGICAAKEFTESVSKLISQGEDDE